MGTLEFHMEIIQMSALFHNQFDIRQMQGQLFENLGIYDAKFHTQRLSLSFLLEFRCSSYSEIARVRKHLYHWLGSYHNVVKGVSRKSH